MLNTRSRAPRKPPDRRSPALMWNMRRRHSSHSCKTPAARMAVKGARSLRVHRSEAQTLDGCRSRGYAASAAPVADATTKNTLHPQDAPFLHDPICNRNGCRRNPCRGGVSYSTRCFSSVALRDAGLGKDFSAATDSNAAPEDGLRLAALHYTGSRLLRWIGVARFMQQGVRRYSDLQSEEPPTEGH